MCECFYIYVKTSAFCCDAVIDISPILKRDFIKFDFKKLSLKKNSYFGCKMQTNLLPNLFQSILFKMIYKCRKKISK